MLSWLAEYRCDVLPLLLVGLVHIKSLGPSLPSSSLSDGGSHRIIKHEPLSSVLAAGRQGSFNSVDPLLLFLRYFAHRNPGKHIFEAFWFHSFGMLKPIISYMFYDGLFRHRMISKSVFWHNIKYSKQKIGLPFLRVGFLMLTTGPWKYRDRTCCTPSVKDMLDPWIRVIPSCIHVQYSLSVGVPRRVHIHAPFCTYQIDPQKGICCF